MEYGVYSLVYTNCHHHITSPELNLKIHYSFLHEWEVRQGISEFPWDNHL